MEIQKWVRWISTKYTNLTAQQKRTCSIIGALLCGLFIALLIKLGLAIASHKQTALTTSPMLIRQGNLYKVPNHSPLRKQLIVRPVILSASPHIISFPGQIEADPSRTVNILPPVTGRLLSLNVKLGEFVNQRQILATMSSPSLAQAYADSDKAKSSLTLAKEALKRTQRVNLVGANAIKDIEAAQNNYNQALAELIRAEDTLKTLEHNEAHHLMITAPLSGTITALNVGIGTYITDPTATLMTLSNLNQVWITADIFENFVRFIAKGQAVEADLSAYPKQLFHGKVSFVSSILDPTTRRNKTRITLSNPDGKFQPNMFATLRFAVPQSNMIVIPKSALLMNNDTTTVFVETAPWTFVRRDVDLGPEDKENVRILSGLATNDRVIIRGGILINDQ